MPVLKILRGLSASGKSTYAKDLVAKDPKWKRVNRDSLRLMVDGGSKWTKAKEKVIELARDTLIVSLLMQEYNVVVDDTNLSETVVKHLTNLAKDIATVEINDDFLSVSLEECIARDLKREVSVGKDVIIKQWVHSVGKRTVIEHNLDLPYAIMCDIDGCLANMKSRHPYEWDKVDTDEVQQHIRSIVNLYSSQGFTVFILSGRDGCCYDLTHKWLKDKGVNFDYLFLRQAGDQRKDSVIKEEIYRREIEGKYNVSLVIDDRPIVCRLWWSLGLPILSNHPLAYEF